MVRSLTKKVLWRATDRRHLTVWARRILRYEGGSSGLPLVRSFHVNMCHHPHLTCLVFDRVLALYQGRSITIHPSDIHEPPVFLDLAEEEESWAPYVLAPGCRPYHGHRTYAVSCFSALIGLSMITVSQIRPASILLTTGRHHYWHLWIRK